MSCQKHQIKYIARKVNYKHCVRARLGRQRSITMRESVNGFNVSGSMSRIWGCVFYAAGNLILRVDLVQQLMSYIDMT